MVSMRNVLFGGAIAAAVFATLRTLQDGPGGEAITVDTMTTIAVLASAGCIVDRLDRLLERFSMK